MATKTYRGSCHCGRVKFEADLDFSQGTGKCNCTSCWKKRWWSIRAQPENFRSISGEEALSGYRSGETKGHRGFCTHCGVHTYAWVPAAEWNDGEYVSIGVASLDDVDPKELAEAPVQYMNGRDDDWWHPPAETRYL